MTKEIWDKPNPNKTHKKLTSNQKSNAKAKAKSAGRKYPSLVDNINASKKTKNEETIATIKRVISENWNKNK